MRSSGGRAGTCSHDAVAVDGGLSNGDAGSATGALQGCGRKRGYRHVVVQLLHLVLYGMQH